MDGRNDARHGAGKEGVLVVGSALCRRWRLAAVIGTAALALLAACSSSPGAVTTTSTASTATTSNSSSTAAPVTGVVNASGIGTHGVILVSRTGATLYRYAPDRTGAPTCTVACATAWPPLTVPAGSTAPTAGSGVTTADLGTVVRSDGALQVTYKKLPLYTYAGDASSGQANGQGVGGLWFVVPLSGPPSTATTGTMVTHSPTKPAPGY